MKLLSYGHLIYNKYKISLGIQLLYFP